jgi:hypothetical protein
MTTFRQIEANRRNARRSTGPVTEEGKQHSPCNAVRHGLTAETVIGALEDTAQNLSIPRANIARRLEESIAATLPPGRFGDGAL